MDEEGMMLAFTADDLDAVDAALATIESRLATLISLRPEVGCGWARMGERSEAFCRETLAAIAGQASSLSVEFDLDRAQADLAAADALHPRLLRLRRLADRAEDTELALGCDVMVVALQARAVLDATGRGTASAMQCEAGCA
jgi:hypothetical protein